MSSGVTSAAAALTGARAEASKKWPNPDYQKIVDALRAQRGLLVCHPAGYPTDWEPAPGTGTAYEAARIKVARGTPTACEEFLQLYATITVDTYKSEKALTAAVKQTRTNQEGDFAWRWDPTVITLEGGDPAIQNSVVGAMKALPGKEKRLYGHNPFADRA